MKIELVKILIMIEGVIFDFNGTLFWDSLLHDEAWEQFFIINNLPIPSKSEMRRHIHGKGSEDIMEYVFGKKLSIEEVHKYTQEKELIYRNLVSSDKVNENLAPGANVLLDYLHVNNFPFTIATSSEQVNVNFFFKHFKLGRWFDIRKTVFDNGEFDLKPAPDIFIKAAEKIEVSISKCLIIEDSLSGVIAAKKAGANKVVYVENNSPGDFKEIKPYVDLKVNRLDEIIKVIS